MKKLLYWCGVFIFTICCGAVVTPKAFASKDCKSRYSVGNQITGFFDLGEVSGTGKRGKCLKRAQEQCYRAQGVARAANPHPGAGVCTGSFTADVDTEVEDRRNSRDGTCTGSFGGSWIGATYSCPAGFSLSGTTCTKSVAGTASCPSGYWLENSYGGKPTKVCVKQACAAGSMPGVGAWRGIGPANGGEYLTDDKGGSRFFTAGLVKITCPSGFAASGYNCVKSQGATLVSAAHCNW